jgi:hypothetical protein
MRRLVPLLVLLLVMAAACTSAPEVDDAATAPAPPQGLPPQLAFTAETIDGGTFDGADYAGQDLMLWFWAPW